MPDGQMLRDTYSIGGTFSARDRFGDCMSERTFSRINAITRILVQHGLMDVRVTKEGGGYGFGLGGAACEYEIVRFNRYNFDRFGIIGGTSDKITVPLVKQTVLGATEVRLNGGLSIGGVECEIAFVPWFSNVEPSTFATYFQSKLEREYRYKNLYSAEYKTSTWCLQRHHDGTWKWKIWSRL